MDAPTAAQYQLTAGDDVFVIGMFGTYVGRERAEPIMRRGYIATVPAGPVRVKLGHDTFGYANAFLCELTSIGGQSGAPVFILPPMYRIPKVKMPEGWPLL